LQREQIVCIAIEPLGPQMRIDLGVDQLSVDADPIARPPDAPFKHIAHPQLTADLLRVDPLILIGEGGAARDNETVCDPRQIGRQILGDRVGKILLLGAIVSRILQRDPIVAIGEGSGPAGFGYLAAAPAIDHLLSQPRLAVEDALVMRPRGVDDFAAPRKERVAKFEYAQIGPSARAMPNDRLQRLLGRPIRARLRQDQRRCRG
jgi:hypothetical protein